MSTSQEDTETPLVDLLLDDTYSTGTIVAASFQPFKYCASTSRLQNISHRTQLCRFRPRTVVPRLAAPEMQGEPGRGNDVEPPTSHPAHGVYDVIIQEYFYDVFLLLVQT